MYTEEEYLYGFREIFESLAPNQLAMLRIQYEAPNRTMTTPQLARAVGWANYNAVNLHYGKMGQKLRDAIPVKPRSVDFIPSGWYVLSDGKNSSQGFQWILRDEVALALEVLEIVDVKNGSRFPDEIYRNENYIEGNVYSVLVNAYERNLLAREACIQHFGAKCSICNFDFLSVYGSEMDGFIHVHHLKPLSEIGESYKIDPKKDLIPVCPNCHAVIHSRRPAFSPEEVRTMLQGVSR